MTEAEFTERDRLWRALKPLLIRSLGDEGAARWMRCAAAQIEEDAPRRRRPIESFVIQPGSPESVL